MKYLKHFAVALALIIVALGIRIYCHTSIPPHIVVSNGKITVHEYGGSNYSLRYEFDVEKSGYFGNRWYEIVQTVEGEKPWGICQRSAGKGKEHFYGFELMETFMNDGTPERIAKLQAKMQEQVDRNPTWAADLQEESAVTFLEYTGLRDKKVSYAIRLIKEHKDKDFSLSIKDRFWRLIRD